MNRYFSTIALGLALLMTSCTGNDEPATFTTTSNTNALLVQISQQDNACMVPANLYKFMMNSNSEAEVALQEMSFGPLNQLAFSAQGTYNYGNYYNDQGVAVAYLYKLTVPDFESKGHKYSNFSCYLTDGYWDDPINSIKHYVGNATIMSYTIDGDWLVRTFPTRAVYPGVTKVYKDGAQVKTYNQLQYIVELNIGEKTANVKLYNPDMNLTEHPEYTILWLRDLQLSCDHRGYYIDGAGAVPQIEDGTAWKEVSEYTFETFRIQVTGDQLTQCTVEAQTLNGYKLSLPSSSYLMVTL